MDQWDTRDILRQDSSAVQQLLLPQLLLLRFSRLPLAALIWLQ